MQGFGQGPTALTGAEVNSVREPIPQKNIGGADHRNHSAHLDRCTKGSHSEQRIFLYSRNRPQTRIAHQRDTGNPSCSSALFVYHASWVYEG